MYTHEGSEGYRPCPKPAISVLITDYALERLALYQRQSDEHAHRVADFVNALKEVRLRGRVLKLSGGQRPVWQCDVDSENCVYFTIGKGAEAVEARIAFFGSPLPETGESYRELLVISGEAPPVALPARVALQDSRITDICPPYPERTVGDSENLDQYLAPTAADLVAVAAEQSQIDDVHGRPFRVLTEIRAPIDLPPRLSPQQREMLTKQGPIFLQGVAGSGKTTLLTHFAHQELLRGGKDTSILMVAYTSSLKEFIERLLRSLNSVEPVDLSCIEVFTWRELCAHLAAHVGIKPIQWASDTEFAGFARSVLPVSSHEESRVDLIPELSELIRSTLKGDTDPDRSMIDRAAFLALPDVGMDRYLDRTKVYEIAEEYQYLLHCRSLYDDLDAARWLLHYREDLPKKYKYVLVDETQDYALAQLRLLAALPSSPQGLFFAGDMNQVVYPSHFNWEKVRTAVYHVWHVPPPEKEEIRYNYRNPQPVSDMANALLKMRCDRLGVERTDSSDSNQPTTPVPIRVQMSRDEVQWTIEQLALHVGSLGVIDQSETHRDIEGIEFQRTFTPQTVKGLEFNVVCLVGFNGRYRELATVKKRRLTPRQMLLQFNEVYVSTTRTRGQLLLIDEQQSGSGLWDCPELRGFTTTVNSASEVIKLIGARYRLSSRDEWKVSAIDFENQHAYGPAGECWERAGVPENAAAAYEKAGYLQKAKAMYKALRNLDGAARVAEQLGQFGEAAELYEAAGQWARASGCWERIDDHKAAARTWERHAETTGSAESWRRAALQYAEVRAHDQSARCLESGGLWEEAALAWTEGKRLLDAARCYERCGKAQLARRCEARHFERERDFRKAAALWELAREPVEATRCWEEAGELENAQRIFRSMGNFRESARLLADMGRLHDAARDYEAAGDRDRAAECLETAGDWENVAQVRKAQGSHRKAAAAFERCQEFVLAAQEWSAAFEPRRAAKAYERANEWNAAADLWERAGFPGKAAECRRQLEPESAGEQAPETIEKVADPAAERVSYLLELLEKYYGKSARVATEASTSWPFRIPDTPENREFVTLVRAAQSFGVTSLASVCEIILRDLGQQSRADALENAQRMLHDAVAQLDPVCEATAAAMNEHPAVFAMLFEIGKRFGVAAELWLRCGDEGRAARCYLQIGQRTKAREICLAIKDSEDAATQLETGGFHLDAALRWIELREYLRATATLDLAGQTQLATIAKAIAFESEGNRYGAAMIWQSVGHQVSSDQLHGKVQQAIEEENAGTSRVRRSDRGGILGAIGRFLRRLITWGVDERS